MKIAFVSTMTNSPWGGSEHLWHQTAAALLRSGHKVGVNVCRWSRIPEQVNGLSTLGAEVLLRYQAKGEALPRAVRKFGELYARVRGPGSMRSWIRRVKPDLICISNGCFDDNIHLSLACAETGVPYVVIAHANGECMWPCDEMGRQVARLYRGARRAYFVADGNRRMLEDQLGISIPNAEIVRNPCAVAHDAVLPWPDESEGFRLACVGRIDSRSKGQDILLRALARLKWRERPITVSLFGDGPNKHALMGLADLLGLTGRVRFAGYVQDITEIWRTHHALALPSRYEGLPISIVEAMLCGRPSIVTDVGGNAEIVEDGRSGFVARWPNEDAFDDALERAWQARASWPSIGFNAHARAAALLPINPPAEFASRLVEVARQSRIGTAEGQVASATNSLEGWSK